MAFGIGVTLDQAKVSQVKNEFGTLLKDLQRISSQNVINIKIGQTQGDLDKISQGLKNIQKDTESSSSSFKTLGSSVKDIGTFFLKWYGATTLVMGAINELKTACSFMTTLDSQITDIAMITGKSREEIQGYATAWNQTAIAMKTTTGEVVSAEEEYLRAGKSVDETNQLVQTNIKLARISNDTNEDTADNLIKLSNAYNLNADGVDKFANKVAYLDSATATSSKTLLTSATYMAGVAQQTGMSMDFMLASLATIQERSKQAPESIARNYRSMLENMQKVTKDGGAELSKLEGVLNKHGVAIRNNSREFKSSEDILRSVMAQYNKWDDVTKSQVGNLIAGKNAMELFNALMLNQDRLQENYNSTINATNTLNEKYKQHLDSVQGSLNELKSTTEKLYMSMLSSNGMNTAIKDLTEIVKLTEVLIVDNTGLTASYVGILIAIKNFGSLKYAIGEVIAFMQLLRTEGLATLTLLEFNPVILAVTALTAVFGTLIYQQYKDKEAVESLSASYKNLSESMKTNNAEGIKNSSSNIEKAQKDLQDNIKAQAEAKKVLDSGMSELSKNPSNISLITNVQTAQSNYDNITKAIKEQEKVLKDVGIVFDETTGKIQAVSQAETLLANNKIIGSIKEKAKAELDNKQQIIGLYDEYIKLNDVENKSAEQKQRMSELAQQLKGQVAGLITVTDEHGNVTIKNTDLIGKEVQMLGTEGATVNQLVAVKLAAAKEDAEIQVGVTSMTYREVMKRISFYQQEMNALNSLHSSAGASMDDLIAKEKAGTITPEEKATLNSMGSWAVAEGVRASSNLIDLNSIKVQVDAIYGGGGDGIDLPNVGEGGFTPEGGSGKSKGSGGSDSTDYTTDSIELNKYDDVINDVNGKQKKLNDTIDITKQKISDYKNLGDNKSLQNAITEENNLYDQQNQKIALLQDSLQKLLAGKENAKNYLKSNYVALSYGGMDLDSMTRSDFNDIEARIFSTTTFSGKGASEQQKAYNESKKMYEQSVQALFKFDDSIQSTNKDLLTTKSELDNIKKDKLDLQLKIDDSDLKKSDTNIKNIEQQISIFNAKSSTDYQKKIDLSQQLITALSGEKDKYTSIIQDLKTQQSSLQEGSVLWDYINDEVDTYKDKLNDANTKLIEVNKQQIQLIENQAMQLIEKQMYNSKTKTAFENNIKAQINALDDQLTAMQRKNEMLQEEETRQKNLLSLAEAQANLQKAQDEENVKQLTKDKDGNWQFDYVANQQTVNDLEKTMRDQVVSNKDWETQTAQKHQEESIQDQKKSLQAEIDIRNEAYNTIKSNLDDAINNQENAFSTGGTTITGIVTKSLNDLQTIYNGKYGTIVSTTKSALSSIDSVLTSLTSKIANAQTNTGALNNTAVTTAQQSHTVWVTDMNSADAQTASNAYGSLGYQIKQIDSSKVSSVASGDILLGYAGTLYGGQVGSKASVVTGADRMETATKAQADAQSRIKAIQDALAQAYAQALAQQQAAVVNPVIPVTTGSVNVSGTPVKPASSLPSGIIASTGTNTSSGHGLSTSITVSGNTTTYHYADGYTKVEKFATGGETGDWGSSDGKIAMLHKKERVLSADQTAGFNDLVFSQLPQLKGMIPSLTSLISNIQLPKLNLPDLSGFSKKNQQQLITQNFNIENLDFPNVSDGQGVVDTLKNLPLVAIQYVNRNR